MIRNPAVAKGVLAVLFIAPLVVFAAWMPTLGGFDFYNVFAPAAQDMVHGVNPYPLRAVHNPPWAIALLIPLSFAPKVGFGVMSALAILSFSAVAWRFEASPFALGAWLLSPGIMKGLYEGNIEWLVLLGLVLPPRWGMFFVVIKPQTAGMVAVYWTYEAWHTGGWRAVVRLLYPMTVAFAASVVLFGAWWSAYTADLDNYVDISLWPWSIPFGVGCLVMAARQHNIRWALIASPLMSPYVLLQSLSGALLALTARPRVLAVVVVALWAWLLR